MILPTWHSQAGRKPHHASDTPPQLPGAQSPPDTESRPPAVTEPKLEIVPRVADTAEVRQQALPYDFAPPSELHAAVNEVFERLASCDSGSPALPQLSSDERVELCMALLELPEVNDCQRSSLFELLSLAMIEVLNDRSLANLVELAGCDVSFIQQLPGTSAAPARARGMLRAIDTARCTPDVESAAKAWSSILATFNDGQGISAFLNFLERLPHDPDYETLLIQFPARLSDDVLLVVASARSALHSPLAIQCSSICLAKLTQQGNENARQEIIDWSCAAIRRAEEAACELEEKPYWEVLMAMNRYGDVLRAPDRIPELQGLASHVDVRVRQYTLDTVRSILRGSNDADGGIRTQAVRLFLESSFDDDNGVVLRAIAGLLEFSPDPERELDQLLPQLGNQQSQELVMRKLTELRSDPYRHNSRGDQNK